MFFVSPTLYDVQMDRWATPRALDVAQGRARAVSLSDAAAQILHQPTWSLRSPGDISPHDAREKNAVGRALEPCEYVLSLVYNLTKKISHTHACTTIQYTSSPRSVAVATQPNSQQGARRTLRVCTTRARTRSLRNDKRTRAPPTGAAATADGSGAAAAVAAAAAAGSP